jgi:hypothetical protein
LVDALPPTLIEPSIPVLALLTRWASVPLATIDRDDAGEALSVDATEPRFAVARGPAFHRCLAQVEVTVSVLALLSNWTTVALTAKDRRETRDALAIDAAESRLAIASRTAFVLRCAAPLAAIFVLAELARRAAITVAAEHLGDFGDAAAFTAGESRLAVAGRATFPFLLAEIPAPVSVLALLAGRTWFLVAAVDRGEAGEALSLETAETGLAVASRTALAARCRHADLRGTVPAGGTARNAGALVPGGTLETVRTAAGRDGWRTHRRRVRLGRHLRLAR